MTAGDQFSEIMASVGKEPDWELNHYEPWDVEERESWIVEKALSDGEKIGYGPEPFQSGSLFSTAQIVGSIAGNQIGKSYDRLMENLMMCTGHIPVSLRYEKGVDTKVKRYVANDDRGINNVLRFGRWSTETGELIDYCPFLDEHGEPCRDPALAKQNIEADGTWDCGTIKGAGIYPDIKIPKGAVKLRISSWKQAREEYWWPRLKELCPKRYLNLSKGTDGFMEQDHIIHFSTGITLSVISYEQGYQAQEAVAVWMATYDEEPTDRRIYAAALPRTRYIRMSYTAINGISWSKKDIVEKDDPNIEIYRANQYDCPYKPNELVNRISSTMKKWERAVKIWGGFSDQTGMPYFNREKLNLWIGEHEESGKHYEFTVSCAWKDPDEVVHAGVRLSESDADNRSAWLVYEDVMDGEAYYLTADTSEGHEKSEDDAKPDYQSAAVYRKVPDADYDVLVAAIKTTLKDTYFWRICLEAASYYNLALMFPEVTGETGSAFLTKIVGYPYIGHMVVTQQATRQQIKKLGFTMTKASRKDLFDYVQEDIDANDDNDFMPFVPALNEASEAVVGKLGRCDHPPGLHNDSLIATWALPRWVKKHATDQVQYHKKPGSGAKSKGLMARYIKYGSKEEAPVVAGSTFSLDELRAMGHID